MKKLMKKIKSNSFFSKAIAICTILMVLTSSLTVFSFAADEDVSAASEEVNSITDTWTSVMNWITSSLGSAQGVFIDNSSPFQLDFGPPITISGSSATYSIYSILNFPDLNVGDSIDVLFDVEGEVFPATIYIYDSTYDSDFYEFTFSKVAVLSDGVASEPIAFYNLHFPGSTYPFEGWYSFYNFDISVPGSFSLSFLGTLAVIGVAIAIILLLVSVIINFLKLRG